ncbi:MAG: hypothetical protein HY329_23245 [Chloroflexi bacterium]|nr:hypothetical protein [Chloroflexota bacterium]
MSDCYCEKADWDAVTPWLYGSGQRAQRPERVSGPTAQRRYWCIPDSHPGEPHEFGDAHG